MSEDTHIDPREEFRVHADLEYKRMRENAADALLADMAGVTVTPDEKEPEEA